MLGDGNNRSLNLTSREPKPLKMKISESEFEHCIPVDGETVTNYLQKDTGTNQSLDVLSLFLGLSEATEIDKKGEPNILKILVYEGILGVT